MKVRNISDKIHESHNIASRFSSWRGGGKEAGCKSTPLHKGLHFICYSYIFIVMPERAHN